MYCVVYYQKYYNEHYSVRDVFTTMSDATQAMFEYTKKSDANAHEDDVYAYYVCPVIVTENSENTQIYVIVERADGIKVYGCYDEDEAHNFGNKLVREEQYSEYYVSF